MERKKYKGNNDQINIQVVKSWKGKRKKWKKKKLKVHVRVTNAEKNEGIQIEALRNKALKTKETFQVSRGTSVCSHKQE